MTRTTILDFDDGTLCILSDGVGWHCAWLLDFLNFSARDRLIADGPLIWTGFGDRQLEDGDAVKLLVRRIEHSDDEIPVNTTAFG